MLMIDSLSYQRYIHVLMEKILHRLSFCLCLYKQTIVKYVISVTGLILNIEKSNFLYMLELKIGLFKKLNWHLPSEIKFGVRFFI